MNQYFVTYTMDGYENSIRTAFVDCEVGETSSKTQHNLKDALEEQYGVDRWKIYIRSVSKIN